MPRVLLLSNYLTSDFLIHSGLLVANFLYFACFLPQILTNFKEKSGTGVSELLLIGYLNAYLFLMLYIFCIDLPLIYRIMGPLELFATAILIIQRLYYDDSPYVKKLWFMYAINIAIFLPLIPYALKHRYLVGAMCGWLYFAFSMVNQLPQVFKIHKEKSVVGFSFLFVLLAGLAAILETVAAFMADLPAQTTFNALRGVLLFVLFCWQFKMYRQ